MESFHGKLTTPTWTVGAFDSGDESLHEVSFAFGPVDTPCHFKISYRCEPSDEVSGMYDLTYKIEPGVFCAGLAWEGESSVSVLIADLGEYRNDDVLWLEGAVVDAEMTMFNVKGGREFVIQADLFFSKKSAAVAAVEEKWAEAQKTQAQFGEAAWLASRTQIVASDVQFSFPRVGNHTIWAKSSILIPSSTYFKTLLSSGFSEGILKKSSSSLGRRTRDEFEKEDEEGDAAENDTVKEPVGDFEDSDDETDEHFSTQLPHSDPPSTTHPYHHVEMYHSSLTTFTAVLCWIETGFIEFAPLSSSFPLATRSQDRLKVIETALSTNARRPLLPSPKSVYRLAHYLELDDLQAVALKGIEAGLKSETVVYELVGEACKTFPEVEDVVFKFAKLALGAVRRSEAWKEIERKLGAGEFADPAQVGFMIMKLMR